MQGMQKYAEVCNNIQQYTAINKVQRLDEKKEDL